MNANLEAVCRLLNIPLEEVPRAVGSAAPTIKQELQDTEEIQFLKAVEKPVKKHLRKRKLYEKELDLQIESLEVEDRIQQKKKRVAELKKQIGGSPTSTTPSSSNTREQPSSSPPSAASTTQPTAKPAAIRRSRWDR